jgi:hypothetical protein
MLSVIYRNDEVIVSLDGMLYTVDEADPRYEDVLDAIRERDEDELETLLVIKKRYNGIKQQLVTEGFEELSTGAFAYNGMPLSLDLSDYIYAALDANDISPVVKFIKRLYENPSHDTRTRLFTFMDKNKMPIDAEGRFLAFKVVNPSFYDKHTGTVYNGVGTTVPRLNWHEVDSDPTHHCSKGYHACSIDYALTFFNNGDKVVSVAIAPEDVASIPDDYNGAKLRCRQYEVLKDVTANYVSDGLDTKLRASSGINPNHKTDNSKYERDFW